MSKKEKNKLTSSEESKYEVELKARIKNINEIRKRVRKIAKFIKKVKKIDDYYSLEKGFSKKSLRIRKQQGFYIVTFKKRVSYKSGIHTKKEIEFNLEDIAGFLAVLKEFGFRKWLTKYKITELYNKEKNLNIELNYVKGLGWFVEIEALTSGKVQEARERILKIFNQLRIKKEDIEESGYTRLLWDKLKNH